MICPKCKSEAGFSKKGFYLRSSDQRRIQRLKCRSCSIVISETYFSIDYRLRLREINQEVFYALCSGVSQRRCALMFRVKNHAIATRLVRFGLCAKNNLTEYRKTRLPATDILIDEMESIEHTKCKPLTMPVVVEAKSRKILALRVGKIAAKGPLAEISRKKYGFRKCERKKCLREVFDEIKVCVSPQARIRSDESHHYPGSLRDVFPMAVHETFKGRRPTSTGLGELKKGGFDPLFYINHTCAMFRCNLKTLARRTWCTPKRPDRLEDLMYLYAWFHNLRIDEKKKPTDLCWIGGNN